MEGGENSDSDQFSDDEVYNNLPDDDFDRFHLTDAEQAELAAVTFERESDDSGEELDDENLPLFYNRPRFEWTDGNDLAPDPATRTPCSRHSGPVRVLDTSMTSQEYFQLYYSDEVLNSLVDFANENAATKRTCEPEKNKGEWKPLTLDELKAYYGLLIMKDLMRLDRDAHYWYTGGKYFLLRSQFGGVMSRDHFFQNRRYLYFVDPRLPNNAGDKLHKIRYTLDKVRTSFMDKFVPYQNVTVDEAMMPFKGRLGFKQFMKDKPVRFGIKLWVAADAQTAYYNMEVYTGKHGQQVNKLMGLSAWVMIGLTKPIHNFGHIIFTDNFYTSPVLAKYLSSKGTYLCGTMRPNRIGSPQWGTAD